ncbi:MAG TPA: hypothetical protein VK783_07025 [Bacteroidia bacterium]|jgi:hypothetical protein|nr:hypothetical protein [Bacteroidia bacterium]
MKNILFFLFLFSFSNLIKAQYSQTAPNFPAPNAWANWISIYNDAGGAIYISFELAPKEPICKGLGYSFFRVQSTYNERVKFHVSFSYVDCNGNIANSSGEPFNNFDFDKGPGIVQDLGNWFLGYAGPSITNIQISDIEFPDREAKAAALKRQQDSITAVQQQQRIDNEIKRHQDSIITAQRQQQQQQAAAQQQQAKQQAFNNGNTQVANDRANTAQTISEGIPVVAEAVGTVMGSINFIDPPRYNHYSWSIALTCGVSYNSIPMIQNMTVKNLDLVNPTITQQYSQTTTFPCIGFNAGAEIWPIRGPHFGIGGFTDITQDIFCTASNNEPGSSNLFMFNYGARIVAGTKRLKGIFEIGIHTANITYTYSDITIDVTSTEAADAVSYSSLRLGYGLMYDFGNETDEYSLTFMLLSEHPDFLPSQYSPVSVGRLQFSMNWVDFRIEYSQNYIIPGAAQYSWQSASNQNYFVGSVAVHIPIVAQEYKHKSN